MWQPIYPLQTFAIATFVLIRSTLLCRKKVANHLLGRICNFSFLHCLYAVMSVCCLNNVCNAYDCLAQLFLRHLIEEATVTRHELLCTLIEMQVIHRMCQAGILVNLIHL